MANVSIPGAGSLPRPRHMALAAFALILVFATLALPGFGFASDTRTANEIVIGETERISDDLYLAGGTVEFNGRAERDVNIAAGKATMDGTIAGSLNLGSGNAEISGTVNGALRVLSGKVVISGTIGGDVLMAGGQLEVTRSGKISGDLIAAGGQVDLRGTLNGDLTGYSANTSILGTILGSVDIKTTELNISNTARITGLVTYTSRKEADVDANAQLAQGIQQKDIDPWGGGDNPWSRASGALLRTLWALIAGAVLVVAAPRLANQVGSNGKRLPIALLFGVIALIGVPIVSILLLGTFVGIPAGMILLALFAIALYLTQVFVGLSIGRFILPQKWNDGSRGFHLLAMTLGVILIGALRFIPVPYVHGTLTLLITIWGIGAFLMLLHSANREEQAAAI